MPFNLLTHYPESINNPSFNKNTLLSLQVKVANNFILILFIISTPLVILSLLRITEIGWKPVMALHLFVLTVIGLTALKRFALALWLKATLLQSFFLLIGIGAVIHNASITFGAIFFLISLIISLIFFQRKIVIIYLLFIIALQLFLSFFILNLPVSFTTLIHIVANTTLSIFILTMMGYMINRIFHDIKLLDNQYLQLEQSKKESLEAVEIIANKNIELQSEISRRKAIETQLYNAAMFDKLTTLPNQTMFKEQALKAIASAQRHNTKMAFMFLDLDGFKDVNDTYGHGVGDAVLVEISLRFSEIIREVDTLGRFGGDEFLIVLPDCSSKEEADKIASRILESTRNPITSAEVSKDLSVSIGISFYPDDGDTYGQLISASDKAMYHSKKSGKNTFSYTQKVIA